MATANNAINAKAMNNLKFIFSSFLVEEYFDSFVSKSNFLLIRSSVEMPLNRKLFFSHFVRRTYHLLHYYWLLCCSQLNSKNSCWIFMRDNNKNQFLYYDRAFFCLKVLNVYQLINLTLCCFWCDKIIFVTRVGHEIKLIYLIFKKFL